MLIGSRTLAQSASSHAGPSGANQNNFALHIMASLSVDPSSHPSHHSQLVHSAYRPEIDGLRTVSVMLVILHHFGWSWIPGGYIGVDVFFVISGFLITSIIVQEARAGKFSIAGFYKRRIIRLAPAYFLVLAATSVAGLVILLPAELTNYFTSVIYSTFFVANIYMWGEVGGYFGAQADVVPLLHLWSLAVEEQFYIFWPFTLLLGLRFIPRRWLWPTLLAVVLASLFVSEWFVQNYRAAAYYLMPTRAFELLLGALLVFLPRVNISKAVSRIMGLAGLTLIMYSALTFSTERLFPGLGAVAPCLGAALILFFSGRAPDIATTFLSSRPMVSIGRVSYPAYLWHWPIIAFLNIHLIDIDWKVGLVTLAATLALSYATYAYVEKPAKSLARRPMRQILSYGFAAPALALVMATGLVTASDGWPGRFPEDLTAKSAAVLSSAPKARGRCNEGNVQNPLSPDDCILGVPDKPVDFLLVGDSHANHFTGMIDVMARDAGLRGYDITQSNTIFLPGTKRFKLVDGARIEYTNFELRNQVLVDVIRKNKYKAVVLAGSFASHYNTGEFTSAESRSSRESFERGMEAAIDLITGTGAKVFIIEGTPVLDGVAYDCPVINKRFNMHQDCRMDIRSHLRHFSAWQGFLGKLKSGHPEIKVIEPGQIMCQDNFCFSEINDTPLYHDENHLNHTGSELLGKLYVAKRGNPLAGIAKGF